MEKVFSTTIYAMLFCAGFFGCFIEDNKRSPTMDTSVDTSQTWERDTAANSYVDVNRGSDMGPNSDSNSSFDMGWDSDPDRGSGSNSDSNSGSDVKSDTNSDPDSDTTNCPIGGWTAGDQTIKLMHDGIERVYEVHVPPGYTGRTPVPLMLAIHGAHNTPWMVRTWSQMNPVADKNGFIVAYPAGIDCWNSGVILPGCKAADDDIGFLRTVVSDIKSHACINPKRVYATGISNGSMMAQLMGCKAGDIFAAVGGVAAGIMGGCSLSRPISVFYIHGTEDRTVSYSSARPNVTGWASRNGCNSTPVETYNVGSTVCETYRGCNDGVEVVFCTVKGMGHCWPEDTHCGPGGGPQYGVSDFKASPMMWKFFERYTLP